MDPDNLRSSIDSQLLYFNRIVAIAMVFIVGGAVFYHYVEKFSWLNSLYFTVVTLATVGYGDFVPKTDAGKIFTIFYIFVGITIFVYLGRTVLARTIKHRMVRKDTWDESDQPKQKTQINQKS